MANTWIMIRHPDKEGDAEGMYLGNTAQITAKGQLQITEVLDRLRTWDEQPQLVLSSTIQRAAMLAGYVARTFKLRHDFQPFFNEIDKPQELVGLSRRSEAHESVMREIRRLFDEDRVPAGVAVKTRSELEAQTREAFTYIEELPYETVLLVGHAKRIASYIHWAWMNCTTLKGYYEFSDRNLKFDTTGITILKRMPDRRDGTMHWHIQTLNDTAHAEFSGMPDPILAELLNKLDH